MSKVQASIVVAVFAFWCLVAGYVVFGCAQASAATPHHHRHHRHHPHHVVTTPAPAPEVLVPHVVSIPGELAKICIEGPCPGFEVYTAPSFANCPPGSTVVGGGYESFGTPGAIVTEDHTVSNNWLIVMESEPTGNPRFRRGRIGQFRSIAQCQYLLPA